MTSVSGTPVASPRVLQWQPVAGCSMASPGCANCVPMQLAAFRAAGLTRPAAGGYRWTGETRLDPEQLRRPLEEATPHVVTVCNHGDLFHPATPDAWIDQVFEVMEATPRHIYQLLTKRAERQRAYITARFGGGPGPAHIVPGVSIERQPEADERVPELLATPALIRTLTVYPLLGPLNLRPYLATGAIRQVVAGAEAARPPLPQWLAGLALQCAEAGVAYQFGEMLAEPA